MKQELNNKITFRVSDHQLEMIEWLSSKFKLSKSETLRIIIEYTYGETQK